jgi:molybdate transport system substrate-binding protein
LAEEEEAMLRKLLWGCALIVAAAPPLGAQELLVSAATSLTGAFKAMGAEFERGRAPLKVAFNFAASDILVKQIVEGAPVDVFAAADQESMDKAQQAKAINPQSRVNFAGNRLVVALPRSSKTTVKALDDLTGKEFRRIALVNPVFAPAGRYAKSVVEKARLWSALQERFILTQNVRQSLDYLARGEVDAAFIYATDVELLREQVRVALEVSTSEPILYPIAMTRASKQSSLAKEFIQLVNGAAGQSILQKFGFSRP